VWFAFVEREWMAYRRITGEYRWGESGVFRRSRAMTVRQTRRDLVTRAKVLLARPLPPTSPVSWSWFVIQVGFAIYVVYISAHLPAPEIAITILGLLAFLATFEEGTSKPQRLFWIVIATGPFLYRNKCHLYGPIRKSRRAGGCTWG
jgi:hypothetical protein